MIKIGQGIDVHAFHNNGQQQQYVMLAGVPIEHTHSLLAHSDGDVVLHALADALLGALALGDIGQHFPSDNVRWKDAESTIFLEHASTLLAEKEFGIENIDATIILQNPKLTPLILQMRKNISEILSLDLDKISVKATTTDRMGFIGKCEGIAATAVILISDNIGN